MLATLLLADGEVLDADVLLFIEPDVVSVLFDIALEDGELLLVPYALEPDAAALLLALAELLLL